MCRKRRTRSHLASGIMIAEVLANINCLQARTLVDEKRGQYASSGARGAGGARGGDTRVVGRRRQPRSSAAPPPHTCTRGKKGRAIPAQVLAQVESAYQATLSPPATALMWMRCDGDRALVRYGGRRGGWGVGGVFDLSGMQTTSRRCARLRLECHSHRAPPVPRFGGSNRVQDQKGAIGSQIAYRERMSTGSHPISCVPAVDETGFSPRASTHLSANRTGVPSVKR
jgi:hypothetical protein